MSSAEERVAKAMDVMELAGVDGNHHRAWVIDQLLRALTGCPELEVPVEDGPPEWGLGESDEYRQWVAEYKAGDDGPETYGWDTGIAP